eukprot:10997350-Ditylum_brightwellii.AAC.1
MENPPTKFASIIWWQQYWDNAGMIGLICGRKYFVLESLCRILEDTITQSCNAILLKFVSKR